MVGLNPKLKLGDYEGERVELELIGKEFYCRYCNSINKCKNHRFGYWWMGILRIGDKKYLIIDGVGETEQFSITINFYSQGLSGSSFFGLEFESYPGKRRTYQPDTGIVSYTTTGGWTQFYPLPKVVKINEKLEEKIENVRKLEKFLLTEDDVIHIVKIIKSPFIFKILKKIGLDLKKFSLAPEFADMIPLLKTYIRNRKFDLRFGFSLVELENTFTTQLIHNSSTETIFQIPKNLKYGIIVKEDNLKIIDYKKKNEIIVYKKKDYYDIIFIESYEPSYDGKSVYLKRLKNGELKQLFSSYSNDEFLGIIGNNIVFKENHWENVKNIFHLNRIEKIENIEVISKGEHEIYERNGRYYIKADDGLILIDKKTLDILSLNNNDGVINIIPIKEGAI